MRQAAMAALARNRGGGDLKQRGGAGQLGRGGSVGSPRQRRRRDAVILRQRGNLEQRSEAGQPGGAEVVASSGAWATGQRSTG